MCMAGNCRRYCSVILLHRDEERMSAVVFRCGAILMVRHPSPPDSLAANMQYE